MNPTQQLAESNLIYKVRSGSHAYGTNLPTSDEDFAGIFIPPVEYFFGLQAFDLLSEQSEVDRSYYSLRKFANLAVANNPNVLELLFVDDKDVQLATKSAMVLRENRFLFLSQRCQKTFVGYAKAQLHRIRTHTKWLSQELSDMAILEPLVIAGKVTKDWIAWRFGENMLRRFSDATFYNNKVENEKAILDLFKGSNIICPNQQDERFYTPSLEPLGAFLVEDRSVLIFEKHKYDEAKKKRDQYVTWMAERNPVRHETELRFGYDTKHAMHLVRLLRAGYEILTTGDLHVRRPDAAELLEIRAGKWSYEHITAYADDMVGKIDSLTATEFRVPPTPNIQAISSLVVHLTQEHLFGSHGDHT